MAKLRHIAMVVEEMEKTAAGFFKLDPGFVAKLKEILK